MAYSPTVVFPYRSSKLPGTGSERVDPFRANPPVPTNVPVTRGVEAYTITAQLILPAAIAVTA